MFQIVWYIFHFLPSLLVKLPANLFFPWRVAFILLITLVLLILKLHRFLKTKQQVICNLFFIFLQFTLPYTEFLDFTIQHPKFLIISCFLLFLKELWTFSLAGYSSLRNSRNWIMKKINDSRYSTTSVQLDDFPGFAGALVEECIRVSKKGTYLSYYCLWKFYIRLLSI